jgi:hypothetical protein
MKNIFAICLGTAACCAVLSPQPASAVISVGYDYTYEFESSTGDSDFNGSTITISGTPGSSLYISDFDLFDNGVSSQYENELQPYADGGNAYIQSEDIKGVYANGFTGTFAAAGENVSGLPAYYYETIVSGNGSSMTGTTETGLYRAISAIEIIDPPGNWIYIPEVSTPNAPFSVPDTTETLVLALMACGALVAARRFIPVAAATKL